MDKEELQSRLQARYKDIKKPEVKAVIARTWERVYLGSRALPQGPWNRFTLRVDSM